MERHGIVALRKVTLHMTEVKPRGVKRGDPKTPGSGRTARGPEPCMHLVSGKVGKTVYDLIKAVGPTDGQAIDALMRELLELRKIAHRHEGVYVRSVKIETPAQD